jgi:hypothetical protein
MPIAALLDLLPTLISGAEDIYALIGNITTTLKTTTEMTPEQQAAFDAHISDLESKPWWTPDA